MDTIVVLTFAGSGAALLGLIAYQLSVGAELRQARRDTSRFPLFAARDDLLAIVADDKMDESDPAWRTMYAGITHLLSLENAWDAVDCLMKYAKFSARMGSDPSLKHQLKKVMKQEIEAAAAVPAFASVRDEVDLAFAHLVRRRTTAWHVVLFLALSLLVLTFTAGLSAARAASKQLRRPSGPSYRGWLATRSDDHHAAA